MNLRRLAFAGDDQTRPAVFFQILRKFLQEIAARIPRQQISRDGKDLAGLHAHALIGEGAGDGRRAFGDVQPVHRQLPVLLFREHTSRRHEITRVTNASRQIHQEIRIQRDDDLRLVEVIDWVDEAILHSERLCQAKLFVVTVDRLVLMPLRIRILLHEGIDLPRERRRGDRAGQQPDSLPAAGFLFFQDRGDHLREAIPVADLAAVVHDLRAIRVVQVQHMSLHPDVG